MGHNFLSTEAMLIKMCLWLELKLFFVLYDYKDINSIFFVFVGL